MSLDFRNDCFAQPGRRMPVAEALAALRDRLAPITPTAEVPVTDAGGRILAESVTAAWDVPLTANAAVDGFAVRSADLAASGETELAMVGRAEAGQAPLAPEAGGAVRILTGAAMPSGFDTVVMQEDVALTGDGTRVRLPGGVTAGANCRQAGEAVRAGQTALTPGQPLRPQDLAMAAAVGRGTLHVHERLRVALVSTGDELVPAGTRPDPGQVVDANRPMLADLLRLAGVAVTDLGALPDSGAVVRERLRAAAADHHVILTSGGASTGDTDHLVAAIQALGALHSWQVAIKPGRPVALGQIDRSVVMALPGNPVAAFVCFLMFAYPALLRLAGAPWWTPPRYHLPAGFAMTKKPGRREWLRSSLVPDTDGTLRVEAFLQTGSGRLQSMTVADGLAELDEEARGVAAGEPIAFIPFSAFGLPPRLTTGLPG